MSWRAILPLTLLLPGCMPPKVRGPVLPIDNAVGIVNTNHRLLNSGLKARGTARGRFADDQGHGHYFSLEATLQILPPDYLRFSLEHVFGGREVEVGMNPDKWWLFLQRPEERYYEGQRGTPVVSHVGTIPLRPARLMECAGISGLSTEGGAARVTDDFQQLIFFHHLTGGPLAVDREYWLDRYEPRLIRRVLFRDGDGRITLSSELDDYRVVDESGLRLPYLLRLRWPADEAEMTLRIDRWQPDPRLDTEHRAFVSPRDRGEHFDHESIAGD